MDEQLLVNETNRQKKRILQKASNMTPSEAETLQKHVHIDPQHEQMHLDSKDTFQEKDIIRLLLENGTNGYENAESVSHYITDELREVEFVDPVLNGVLNMFKDNPALPPTYFTGHEDERVSGLAIELMAEPYDLSQNWFEKHEIILPDKEVLYKKDVESGLLRYKLKRVMGMIKENETNMKSEKENIEVYLKVHTKLLEMKQQLCQDLGTVIF